LLSQYLNDALGLSFFDYINGLRVAEVQKMMRDRSNDTRTLLDLAFAAGFTSKSTFNTSFKKISGLAPSSWRNQHVKTSGPIG
jgi:AraC-like DNA-binding protein